MAYQGGHKFMDWMIKAACPAMELHKPNLHIFIDIDSEIAIKRKSKNRNQTELYQAIDNLIMVRNKYHEAI